MVVIGSMLCDGACVAGGCEWIDDADGQELKAIEQPSDVSDLPRDC
jgi:hypothetical protein